MRYLVLGLMLTLAGCGPRRVEVRTAPPLPAENALDVSNKIAQDVNVYVTYNGSDHFIQAVRANTSVRVPVRDIPLGSTVTIWAKTFDGARSFTRQNVVLNGVYYFPIP